MFMSPTTKSFLLPPSVRPCSLCSLHRLLPVGPIECSMYTKAITMWMPCRRKCFHAMSSSGRTWPASPVASAGMAVCSQGLCIIMTPPWQPFES